MGRRPMQDIKRISAKMNEEEFVNKKFLIEYMKKADSLRYHKYRLSQKGWIWTEQEKDFDPTYKRIPNSEGYNTSCAPAYTDRIFGLSRKEESFRRWKFEGYTSIPEIRESDHVPVTVDGILHLDSD